MLWVTNKFKLRVREVTVNSGYNEVLGTVVSLRYKRSSL